MWRPPSPATRSKIHQELHQEPDITAQDVRHLKEWIRKQPHLPTIEDEAFLERFLYGCKYRLHRCKQVLDMYYTVRGAVPDFFRDRDPTSETVRNVAKTLLINLLPRHSPAGYRVIMFKLQDYDFSNLDVTAHFKRCFMLLDLQLQMECVLGYVVVIDFKNATLSHITRFTPPLLKKFLVCCQDAYPIRIKEIHFVNASMFVNTLLEIVKPMLKEKLRKRVYVHSKGVEDLCESIPSKMLPSDYGGKEDTSESISDAWQKLLESHRDWFKKEESRVTDETKRFGKLVDSVQLFEMDGCFRKLIID